MYRIKHIKRSIRYEQIENLKLYFFFAMSVLNVIAQNVLGLQVLRSEQIYLLGFHVNKMLPIFTTVTVLPKTINIRT